LFSSAVSPLFLSTHQQERRLLDIKGRRGFALLITITLLSFLVLLVISLAALTRVETSVAANNQSLAQARQNALIAMNIAIGQLQKHAGPDARITARAEITSTGAVPNPNLTGVWNVAGAGSAADVWLVGGSETASSPAALLGSMPDPADDTLTADTLFLVGNQTVAVTPSAPTAAEKARRVKVTKQNIAAPAGSVPGLDSAATPQIGRYAWWVGDQGVKASLALPDRVDEITYAPWNTAVQRKRIRQQIASIPNYFRATTATTAYAKEGFDPIMAGSALRNVQTEGQFGLVTPVAGSMPEFMRGRFHDFTTASRGVLSNTRTDAHAGLMRDLSLKPDELGNAFKAYADYSSYMEAPGSTLSGADAAFPAITDADSPRRRYKISVPVSTTSAADLPDLVFGVAPVLNDFLLQFRFFHSSANVMTARVRLYVGMWNPYTSALAPSTLDDLTLEVTGLPTVTIRDDVSGATAVVDLQAALPAVIRGAGGELSVKLPFGNTLSTNGTTADRSSWLPGRVYGWTTPSGTPADNKMGFYNKTLNVTGWSYLPVALAGTAATPLSATTNGINVPGLTIRVRSGAGILATYKTPEFSAVDAMASSTLPWRFGFATSLKQPLVGNADRTWLKKFDPRRDVMPAGNMGGFDVNQDTTPLDPNVYSSATTASTTHPEYLLYRVMGSNSNAYSQGSYNDVPLFELPRLPLLSVGELQHVQIKNTRPFAVGNSWGGSANAVFDRYFFSGLPATVSAAFAAPDLAAGQPFPNWNLHVADGSDITAVRTSAAFSSRHLLQAGVFNINSTSAAAWRAVLSMVRMTQAFEPADIENSSGDAFGTQKAPSAVVQELFNADTTLGTGVAAPAFFRFSQSAQETYFWKSAAGSLGAPRQFSTHAFRLGVRGSNDQTAATSPIDASITAQRLTTDQIESLATEIVRLLKTRAAASGPFRTLEEFLSPQAGAGTPSLLEAAIEAAALNPDEIKPLDNVSLSGGVYGAGFSSLTLTQADILTALAPYLRARSDTFMIRTYGETLNPVTAEVTGKAWLEATVQRFPETVAAGDNIDKPTGVFGRRFKITAFRWLSPSDI
jgi:hypothetical protein